MNIGTRNDTVESFQQAPRVVYDYYFYKTYKKES